MSKYLSTTTLNLLLTGALSVVAGNGSIPIHPNDPSHQYTFPLNQSTVRCPTLDDVPTYANYCAFS
jgi:hypothetical protein